MTRFTSSGMSSACQSANMADMEAAPSEKAPRLPKPPSTLIIPYGLKSVLKALSHAALVEMPSDIAEYMASYCKEIQSLREEHPQLSIEELTTLQRFRKGHSATSSTSVVPCLSDLVLDVTPHANAAKMQTSDTCSESLKHFRVIYHHDEDLVEEDVISPVSAEPVSHSDNAENALIQPVPGVAGQSDSSSGEGIHVPCLEMEEEKGTVSSVQSALFVRASPEKCPSNESLVLALKPPSQSMIIVHSDNLPNVLVFQNSEQQQQSSTTSASPSKEMFKKPDESGSQENTCPDVVVFHKVPAAQDVAKSINLSEVLEELEILRRSVEMLEPAHRAASADILLSEQPAPGAMSSNHSGNLPNVIVVQDSEQQSSAASTYSSKEGSQVNACPEVVVFYKVPSVQSINLLEELDLDNLTNKVVMEVLEPVHGEGAAESDILPSDQPAPEAMSSKDKGSQKETSILKIKMKRKSSTEIRDIDSNSQTSESAEVVEIYKVPSEQDWAQSNGMANITDENTSPEHVVERARTQQEISSSHEPLKTIQFMEPLAMTAESLLKRKVDQTSAVSIKKAINERNKLIKKILQSAQLKTQTDISKPRITGITISSQSGGWPAHIQNTLEATPGRDSTGGVKLEATAVQTAPVGPASKMISPDIDPALQSSVNQVWSFYQNVSQEKGGHTTIAGNFSHISKSEPSEKESGQSPKPSPLPLLINTPNYVLVNDDTGRNGNYPSEEERSRYGASRNWMRPCLSISLPVDPFCNDPAGNQPHFYALTSDQGNMACSPVFVHEINSTNAARNDENRMQSEITSSPSVCMQWSIQITLKKSTGEQ